MDKALLLLLASGIVAVFAMLFMSGLIGPKRIKDAMRALNRWIDKDATLFFPVDPYKPVGTEVREGLRNFWPSSWRMRNSLRLYRLLLIVLLLAAIISLIVAALRR